MTQHSAQHPTHFSQQASTSTNFPQSQAVATDPHKDDTTDTMTNYGSISTIGKDDTRLCTTDIVSSQASSSFPALPGEDKRHPRELVPPSMGFPPPELVDKIDPADRADALLMAICKAMLDNDNRALCPKEIAELLDSRGWLRNAGSAPYNHISTCIRSHLRRVNAANPPYHPLLVSFDLTGPPLTASEVRAVGFHPDEKPIMRRGTLWYTNILALGEGCGAEDPFLRCRREDGLYVPNDSVLYVREGGQPRPSLPLAKKASNTTASSNTNTRGRKRRQPSTVSFDNDVGSSPEAEYHHSATSSSTSSAFPRLKIRLSVMENRRSSSPDTHMGLRSRSKRAKSEGPSEAGSSVIEEELSPTPNPFCLSASQLFDMTSKLTQEHGQPSNNQTYTSLSPQSFEFLPLQQLTSSCPSRFYRPEADALTCTLPINPPVEDLEDLPESFLESDALDFEWSATAQTSPTPPKELPLPELDFSIPSFVTESICEDAPSEMDVEDEDDDLTFDLDEDDMTTAISSPATTPRYINETEEDIPPMSTVLPQFFGLLNPQSTIDETLCVAFPSPNPENGQFPDTSLDKTPRAPYGFASEASTTGLGSSKMFSHPDLLEYRDKPEDEEDLDTPLSILDRSSPYLRRRFSTPDSDGDSFELMTSSHVDRSLDLDFEGLKFSSEDVTNLIDQTWGSHELDSFPMYPIVALDPAIMATVVQQGIPVFATQALYEFANATLFRRIDTDYINGSVLLSPVFSALSEIENVLRSIKKGFSVISPAPGVGGTWISLSDAREIAEEYPSQLGMLETFLEVELVDKFPTSLLGIRDKFRQQAKSSFGTWLDGTDLTVAKPQPAIVMRRSERVKAKTIRT